MRRFIQLLFAFWFGVSMTLAQVSISAAQTSTYGSDTDGGGSYSSTSSGSHFDMSGYTTNQSESQALTEYLTKHKLPLVGAQVLNGPEGRMVVLYGFVGSDFGKADAVKKTRRFLHNSAVRVDNRINVRPELLASNRPSSTAGSNSGSEYPPAGSYSSNPGSNPGSGYPPAGGYASSPEGSSSPDASSYPGPESYKAQQANPYMQQFTSMMPLIALLGALGMSMAGGSSGFSFGSSPFGSPSYGNPYSSPYGGHGSPYGGSPFGGSPFGGSPGFGGSPYGGSPYGNPPYGSAPYPSP